MEFEYRDIFSDEAKKMLEKFRQEVLNEHTISSQNRKNCLQTGCRNLETVCKDCGRVVCTREFPAIQQWINVKYRLPEDDEEVLILLYGYFFDKDPLSQKKSHKLFQGSFNRGYGWNKPFAPEPSSVTHWMPLPKAPNE